jgi:DNA-binding SARP family transcriptional activator
MGDTTSARLRLKTLGSFEVIVDGAPVPEEAWPRRKTKGLLKLLLTAPGDVFTVDQLIDALLPDSDVGRAGSNIRARVSELRSVLEPDLQRGATSQYVKRIGEGYSFCPDSDSWLDTFAFERQVSEGHRNAGARRLPEAIDALESAIALYRGEFLAEDRYAEWAESKRSQLRERFLGGLTRLAACQAKLGRLHEAAASCRRALAIDPPAWGQVFIFEST